MDLKTGNLLWPALNEQDVALASLTKDVACDVVVLGAGITGVLSGLMLAEAGLDVVVLDRRGIGEGSTPASTALVQYEIDTPLIDLARDIGLPAAQMAYSACRRALDDLVELTRRLSIDCDLHWNGSLFLACDESEQDTFIREAAARQAIGIEVEPLSRRELMARFDIDRPAALHSLAGIELDPLKLTLGLAAAAERAGARFFCGNAESFDLQSDRPSLRTGDGVRVTCRHLVIATGYETPEQFQSVGRYCKLKSTYALATEPLAGVMPWPGRVLIWESGNPYFYARQTADQRIIVGGEDEPFVDPDKRDALIDSKSTTLLQKLETLRPGLSTQPEYCWAGTFAESADGLPLIGQLPKFPGCHFALGYGGNGLTFAMLAAQILRDQLVGRENPLARALRFNR